MQTFITVSLIRHRKALVRIVFVAEEGYERTLHDRLEGAAGNEMQIYHD